MLDNGEVVQVVRESLRIPLPVEDLSACLDPEQQAHDRIVEEAGCTLDLERGPLIRARVLRLNSADHVLLLTLHHIFFDQWSRGILARELSVLYDAYHACTRSPLSELRLQYADYAVWQRQHLQGNILEKHLAYWKQQLANAPAELTLPTDRPRPRVQTFRGARTPFHFSQTLTERLTQFSRQQGTTLFMTLLTGFHALLSRYSGQDDVVVGTPTAGRNRPETEGIIGFFANTLALRLDLSGDPPFEELIQRTKKMTLDAYQHQEMPFENLVEELNPERSLSHNPLFQALFSLGNLPQYAFELPELELRWAGTREAKSKFDISVFMHQQPDHLAGRIEYNRDLFDEDRIGRMIGHYQVLLEAAAKNPELRLSELPLLTAGEEAQILVGWNATATEYPRDLCLHQLFEQQATRTPDAVACVFEQDQLSYRELNERANQLARYLKHRGVGPGQKVGVYVERSLAMMVSLLGVQKSGAAYVPLDPAYPAGRIRLTLEDAQAPVLLTESSLLESLPANGSEIICLDRDGPDIAQQDRANPPNEAGPEDLIYVMFTSGSTGRPKGVQVLHRAVVNLLSCMKQQLRMGPDDVFPALTSFAFDISIAELYLPLVSGGRVVVAPRDLAGDGKELAKFLRHHGATAVQATPTTWNLLLQAEFTGRGLKRVIGAEALPQDLCRRLLEADGTLHNYYGPTETTVWSAMHCFRAKEEPVVVGRPLANTQIYILDRNLRPVPIGVTGEIFIGGDGVARGYLNLPALTAEKFLPDPFSAKGRLYRTGDLARFRPDGTIEYLGRGDNQVKIRGFRIELGEVETVLGQHPAVAECVVAAREDLSGDKRLVGYVVAAGQAALPTAELRAFVKARLPEYMVPVAWVQLERFPLTANGKVDRQHLPAPEYRREDQEHAYVGPRTPAEEVIAGIWAQVLKLDRVGVEDNFFELGGHSLLGTQVVSRIQRAFGVELPLRALFEAPTVAGLAEQTTAFRRQQQGIQALPVRRVKREGPLPLSYAQQRLWFLYRLKPQQALYNVPYVVRLQGRLHASVLERSLRGVVERHEALRTRFEVIGGEPAQVIEPVPELLLVVTDLSGLAEPEREPEAQRQVTAEALRPFDLRAGPLLRASLWKLAEQDHVLVLNTHHSISDGWSLGVLWEELTALYLAGVEGQHSLLEPLPLQYGDYAVWQREFLAGERLEQQLAYWKQQLAGAPPVLELPADRPRPALETFRGARQSVLLPPILLQDLRQLSRKEGVTLFMTLLGAFSVLLSRYTGQDDIVVGSPIAGRNQAELEKLIGFFVNTLVLRTNLGGNPTVRELLGQVRETVMEAYAHSDVPFERLVKELRPDRDLNRNPLFQVMLVLQNLEPDGRDLPGLASRAFPISKQFSKFDLTLFAREQTDGLRVTFEYNTDLFDGTTIERLCGHFQNLLEAVVNNPELRLSALPLLTPEEKQRLLVEFNDNAQYYPPMCVHELFAAQARRRPQAVAVVFRDQRLSYGELEARSSRLAAHLRRLGVGPGVPVGLCVERSLETVVGLLGILKAGGAYVPLDPSYPSERLKFLIHNAETRIVLTKTPLSGCLRERGTRLVFLDRTEHWGTRNAVPGPARVTLDNLAYLMYTSGTSGEPKAVEIPHRGIVRLLFGVDYARFGESEVFLHMSPLSFDASTLEIWGALLHGARLVLFPGTVPTIEELGAVLSQEGVTTLWLTSSLFNMVIDMAPGILTSVRQLLVGGEALSVQHVQRALELLPDTQLINGYGPTESTTFTACYRIPPDLDALRVASIPLGRPIANTRVYVLDRQRELAPVGVPGELYIGGDGLARGYLKQPELTAQKFMPNPFSPDVADRLYVTGDLARYRADGNLEFLGRLDDQVKLRGYRIEPGEIETMLGQQPDVKACVVVAREDTLGNKRLAAYVVPRECDATTPAQLRQRLEAKLPSYMVPSAFVLISALPLTPNGKVDRKALPAPEHWQSETKDGCAPPRTPLEEKLVSVWSEVLRNPGVGVHDDFFELGGDSLLAVRLCARMEQALNLKLPLHLMFTARTVEEVAASIVSSNQNCASAKSSIIPCRIGGTKAPIFAAPPDVELEVLLVFRNLTRRLEPEQPMYTFAKLDSDREWTSLEELAANYVKDLREFQPRGPYHLIGWSLGGMIAFEMACQLRAQNQAVGLLGLLDSGNLALWRGRTRLQRFRGALRHLVHRDLKKLRTLAPVDWPRRLVALLNQYLIDTALRELYRLYQALLKKSSSSLRTMLLRMVPRHFKRAYGKHAWGTLGEHYTPKVYPGKIVFFESEKSAVNALKSWSGFAHEVELIRVPGNHVTMLDEPQVGVLAAEITKALARSSADPTQEATSQGSDSAHAQGSKQGAQKEDLALSSEEITTSRIAITS
jgi:amino acid adenylation domain-containing protein